MANTSELTTIDDELYVCYDSGQPGTAVIKENPANHIFFK